MNNSSDSQALRELRPLPAEDWHQSLSHIRDDMGGRPINIHRLMAHHPALLQSWWSFRNHSVNGGALPRREGELVILRVAARLKNWYEWASHVDRGLKVGLTLEEIDKVKGDLTTANWPPREHALLRAVDDCLDHRRISKPVRAALEMHFSDMQIMDIIAIHGMYVILGTMIDTWGLELDPHIDLPSGVTNDF